MHLFIVNIPIIISPTTNSHLRVVEETRPGQAQATQTKREIPRYERYSGCICTYIICDIVIDKHIYNRYKYI